MRFRGNLVSYDFLISAVLVVSRNLNPDILIPWVAIEEPPGLFSSPRDGPERNKVNIEVGGHQMQVCYGAVSTQSVAFTAPELDLTSAINFST